MTHKSQILAQLCGTGRPLYLPDLTLWYDWHHGQHTLPAEWADLSLPEVARAMGVPIWLPVRPWRVETPGIPMTEEVTGETRLRRGQTPAGTLEARWVVGPDGDWWQEKHLISSAEDIPAARLLAEAITYRPDPEPIAGAQAEVGEDGVVVLQLPRRPYSDLLHDFVGWGEGLLFLMGKERDALLEIHALLEDKLQTLVAEVAALPGEIILSPDNWDGQYLSPRELGTHVAPSYQRTTETLHRHGKLLVVHVGGVFKRMLAPLAAAGVDAVEGISGRPQGDASLAEAREIAGPELALWGGIPQDFLMAERSQSEFEAAVAQAVQEAQAAGRCLIGVADRVPTTADPGRLRTLPDLIQRALG